MTDLLIFLFTLACVVGAVVLSLRKPERPRPREPFREQFNPLWKDTYEHPKRR